ncbi:hypothetical protein [Prevotella sp. KH2C16]|uniref:hypothetical protein n=1 Tax=Prevotella sp. KH2C16 TaxID=1855325 RepID=UPI0008E45D03|nr:hypothetical protein [Prevotella sp. KH2C16]SFG01145.1 hypothetical protein SAMN05216383_103231 [Prevotella sp. KH2C16]
MIRKILSTSLLLLVSFAGIAQEEEPFKGYFINKEYNVYLQIDFYKNNIIIPGQEVFGEIPGFFGDKLDGRKWLITDAKIINDKEAEVSLINDVASEDLTAKIKLLNDSTLRLKQVEGSVLKIARNRKWVKMPKVLEFKSHK